MSIDRQGAIVFEIFRHSPEKLKEVVDIFIDTIPPYLETALRAAMQHDEKTLREALHAARGSAANFGCTQFVQQCRNASTCAEQSEWKQCQKIVGQIIMHWHNIVVEDLKTMVQS